MADTPVAEQVHAEYCPAHGCVALITLPPALPPRRSLSLGGDAGLLVEGRILANETIPRRDASIIRAFYPVVATWCKVPGLDRHGLENRRCVVSCGSGR